MSATELAPKEELLSFTAALKLRTQAAIEPIVEEISDGIAVLKSKVSNLVIDGPDAARPALDRIKDLKAEIETKIGPVRDTLHECHKATTEPIARLKKDIDGVQLEVSRKVTLWKNEEERKRREAEEAARKEREERDRIAREAEVERLAKLAEQEKAKGNTQAVAAINEAAAAVIDAPPEVPQYIAPPPPKIEARRSGRWAINIIDANLIPRAFCVHDDTKLREHAKASNGQAIMVMGKPVVTFTYEEKFS